MDSGRRPQPQEAQRRVERKRATAVDELPVVEVDVDEAVEADEAAREHPERVGRGQLEQIGARSRAAACRGPASCSRGASSGEIALAEGRRRAVDVAERRERLRDRLVEIPAAAAEEARREVRARAATPPRRARSRPRPTRPRARLRRAAPVRVVAERRELGAHVARARASASSSSPEAACGGRSSGVTTKPAGRRSSRRSNAAQTRRRAVARRDMRRPRTVQALPRAHLRSEQSSRCRRGRWPRRCRGSSVLAPRARLDPDAPTPRRATTSRRRSSRRARSASSPAIPSASTQPLYGCFLVPLYWVFGRTWDVVGIAQIVGRRGTAAPRLHRGGASSSRASRCSAAVVCDPQPVPDLARRPRQPRDHATSSSLAGIVLVSPARRPRRLDLAAAAARRGSAASRSSATRELRCLPLVLAAFVWLCRVRSPADGRGDRRRRLRCRRLAVADPQQGRRSAASPITTDAPRALEGKQREHLRDARRGKWIDDVPQPSCVPADARGRGRLPRDRPLPAGERVRPDALLPAPQRQVRGAPSRREGQAAAQATAMLWDPRVHETQGGPARGPGATPPAGSSSRSGRSRSTARAGRALPRAPRAVRRARREPSRSTTPWRRWSFAGTTRYRVVVRLLAGRCLPRARSTAC